MTGVWRDENGTPMTRTKKLAPAWYGRQVDDVMASETKRKRQVMNSEVASYQQKRRHRINLGRDIMTGMELKPRRIIPPGSFGMPVRHKKPTTIVPEGTAVLEAASDGIVGEPDTAKGLKDWDKYKNEKDRHGKKPYQRIILPED